MEKVIKDLQIAVVPEYLLKAQTIVNAIAISYADAERGLSLMNLIKDN